ncbi:hypothetical protein NUU61_001559 [Penicillium alfredii]|uniref:Uncharacterized protein n=1 Tax=Penicillium alfredii TaxID=1506179 RepID=A0A9W9KM71_9EURO|nr:uncharacterized protein NUU61_001559 [Penicillium alfredii]KAJ5111929.1 hypothetical protein NUU61_001559 [Penicillium alfredii]
MNLWKEMVKSNKLPLEETQKLKYNAERLVCTAIVQEYHVIIQEGLEYSYLTNGIARVLLCVPHDNPDTLHYFLCDPNRELEGDIEQNLQEPRTSVARVLCLCLMAFRSTVRGQEWRHATRSQLPLWTTSFDHARSQIRKAGLQQAAPHSDSTNSEYVSPELSSEYQQSSPPLESPTAGRRAATRSQANCANCAPLDVRYRMESPDSSDSDVNHAASGRKRGFSQVTSSPSAQRAARQREARNHPSGQLRRHEAQFCTQTCLLGVPNGGVLDDCCPNVNPSIDKIETTLGIPSTQRIWWFY